MRRQIVTMGIFLGMIFVFIFILLHFINPLFLQYFWINFLVSVLFSWLFVHWLVQIFRRENGGLSGYGDVLKVSFVTLTIALFIFSVFQLLFYNLMVPAYFETYKDQILKLEQENTRMIFNSFQNDDVYLEQLFLEQSEQYDEKKNHEFKSLVGVFILLFESLINSLLFSLAISFFYRKSK